jgi:hypothetical protein
MYVFKSLSFLFYLVCFQMTSRLDLYAKELGKVMKPEFKQNIVNENSH